MTVIHDTIPLRHGGGIVSRMLKRVFFLAVAHLTSFVLTDSEASKHAIQRDLRVPPDRIGVMRFPIQLDRAVHVAELRRTVDQQNTLLYVGRFDRHKNLHRLCTAFSDSAFARRKGRLLLVGGWDDEVRKLKSWVSRAGLSSIDVRGACSEQDLDLLLASSTALIMPSLEEGYGLPAFEAAASGLPVAVSPTGAMSGLPPDVAVQFDPTDEHAIARAIDEVTRRAPRAPSGLHEPVFREVVLTAIARAR